MDVFWLNIDGEEVLLYRCIYAPVKSNMFIMVNGKEAIVIDPIMRREFYCYRVRMLKMYI